MKKIYKIIPLIIILMIFINIKIKNSYARYRTNIDVSVNDNSGQLICNGEVTGSGIDSEGLAYFDVTVTNYIDDDITSTNVKYNINVTNSSNNTVTGLYEWYDGNNTNGEFLEEITTNDYYFGNSSKESKIIRFKIINRENVVSSVSYNIKLNCYQVGKNNIEGRNPTGSETLLSKTNSKNIDTYTDGNTHEMYTFSHTQTEQTQSLTDYRYIGNDPYNYVKFNCDNDGTNCEIWRIIGVFDVDDGNGTIEKRIKLVRGSSIKNDYWNNGSNKNDWTDANASLKNFLNGTYYDDTESATKNNYDLKASARSLIDDAVFYLGGTTYDSTTHYGSTEEIYTWERGTKTCVTTGSCSGQTRPTQWTGKVALMYPSDEYMVYGKGINATCYNNPYQCNNSTIASTGWVYNSNILEGQTSKINTWLLSPHTTSTDNEFAVFNDGNLNRNSGVTNSYGVRPIVYLKPDVIISSGDGSSTYPYELYQPTN